MQIKFLKEITILSCRFKIEWDKTHSGGSFSVKEGNMVIGIQCYKEDPGYTFNILTHEISEAIHVLMSNRYENTRIEGDYLFSYGHQSFENHNELLAENIIKFLK